MIYKESSYRFEIESGEICRDGQQNSTNCSALIKKIFETITHVIANDAHMDTKFSIYIGKIDFYPASESAVYVADDFASNLKNKAKELNINIEVSLFVCVPVGKAIDDMVILLTRSYLYLDKVYLTIPSSPTILDADTCRTADDFKNKNNIYLIFLHSFSSVKTVDEDLLLDVLRIVKPVDFAFTSFSKQPPQVYKQMKQSLLLKQIL